MTRSSQIWLQQITQPLCLESSHDCWVHVVILDVLSRLEYAIDKSAVNEGSKLQVRLTNTSWPRHNSRIVSIKVVNGAGVDSFSIKLTGIVDDIVTERQQLGVMRCMCARCEIIVVICDVFWYRGKNPHSGEGLVLAVSTRIVWLYWMALKKITVLLDLFSIVKY